RLGRNPLPLRAEGRRTPARPAALARARAADADGGETLARVGTADPLVRGPPPADGSGGVIDCSRPARRVGSERCRRHLCPLEKITFGEGRRWLPRARAS